MRSRPPERQGGRRVDLHAHTIFSDGSLTPEELVQFAAARDLSALSVTDHDSIEALPFARAAAAGLSLEIVPGIEISCVHGGSETHILGYFIDPEDGKLRARLERFREDRKARIEEIVTRLNQLGVPVDLLAVLALAGPGVVGRPHVAEALIRARHVVSLDEAFRRYLGPQGQAFVPRPAFETADAIALIHDAGGVSVLAHPGATIDEARVEELADAGLRGIEIWHPQHGGTAIRRLRAMAARHGLLETGGSDFHGPQRGADLGGLPVPAGVLQQLKDAAGVAG